VTNSGTRCRQTQLAVVDLLLDELEADELVRAGEHLAHCAPCRSMLLELTRTSRILRRCCVRDLHSGALPAPLLDKALTAIRIAAA
jgi:predicted anti-sigma-YlaC factor YlaD